MRLPCEFCGRGLWARFSVDLSGAVHESVELCGCEKAKKQRGECVECGGPVWRKRAKWCPKHKKLADRKRWRGVKSRARAKDPEASRAYQRRQYWANREHNRARSRSYYHATKAVRSGVTDWLEEEAA